MTEFPHPLRERVRVRGKVLITKQRKEV